MKSNLNDEILFRLMSSGHTTNDTLNNYIRGVCTEYNTQYTFSIFFYNYMVSSWSDLMIDIITQGKLPEVNVEPVQVFVHFMLNVSFESDSKDATMVGFWEKKSEIRPNALFWSEFGGILRSLEKFGGI